MGQFSGPTSRPLRGIQGSPAMQLVPFAGTTAGINFFCGTGGWGAWGQVEAVGVPGFLLGFSVSHAQAAENYALQFGYGAAGAEVPMGEWQGWLPNNSTYAGHQWTFPVPLPYPAGRLAVRAAHRSAGYQIHNLLVIVGSRANLEY